MSHLAIPPGSEASYNGFVWNNTTQTLLFSGRPVYDSAGRTIIHTNFTLTLTCVIQAVPTDPIVRAAIAALTQPACGLVYTGRGVGNVIINLPGGGADCVWGPKPQDVTAKPYGAGNATRLTWTVTFAIPTCDDARFSGPMEFLYKVTVTQDKSGYSQRTYAGHLVIAQTRTAPGNRVVQKSADQWRELVNPPMLNGFRRATRTWDISEDNCRLDFDVHDEQMPPNVPPPGVVEADASHTFRMAGQGRLYQWIGTLEATYEMSLDTPVDVAVNAFFDTAGDRINAVNGAGFARLGAIFRKPVSFWPYNFTFSDAKIYDKTTVRCSLEYMLSGVDMPTLLTAGGLWRPVPGSNWARWATSMTVPLGARGWATSLQFTPGEDTIVDLCAGLTLPQANKPAAKVINLKAKPAGTMPSIQKILTTPPTPRTSWLNYDIGLRVEVASNLVVGSTLPSVPLTQMNPSTAAINANAPNNTLPAAVDASFFPPATDVVAGDGSSASQNSSAGGTFIQQRAMPQIYVFLTGSALRVGYPIPVPTITDVGGSPVALANRTDMGEGYDQQIVGTTGLSGYPVYYARWVHRYILPVPPSMSVALTIPPSPIIS